MLKLSANFQETDNTFTDILGWGITPDHTWSNWLIWLVDFFLVHLN
jgi:GH35 family endo-1,4-beta-xylanase